MVFNPLFLYLSNLVSSDCLFAALSLVWFTLLLWIVRKATMKIIIWQGIILFVTFSIRYNALIYPVITIAAFLLSSLTWKKKALGIAFSLILCGLFVLYTSDKYEKLTGVRQYSPFSGWQLANNAMYAYRYVHREDRKPVPRKFEVLDNMIRAYFDSTRNVEKYPIEAMKASTFYMWSPNLPLVKYKDELFKRDSNASNLEKWASMGPFYKEYGLYVIRKYPFYYIRYFALPNASKYYAPPVEFLGLYNSGSDYVTPEAKEWFGYKSDKVKTRTKSNKVFMLDFLQILSGIINVLMVCTIVCYAMLKGWKYGDAFKKAVLLGSIVWLLNAVFTIGASSAALRFQSFPILLVTTFTVLLIDWMVQLMAEEKVDPAKFPSCSLKENAILEQQVSQEAATAADKEFN
jgi:hypothetical protein